MKITIKKVENEVIIEYLLLFFTGFVALSVFANVILNKIGFYLIELLVFPILFFYHKQGKIILKSKIILSKLELIFTGLLLVSISLGIVNTNAFSALTCIRPFIYILIIIKYIFENKVVLSCDKLYVLSVGCVMGDYFYSVLFSKILVERGYQHINIIAVALIVIIPILKQQNILSIVSMIVAFYVAFFSGYRINILITIIVIATSIVFNLISNKDSVSSFKYFIVFIALSIGMYIFVKNIESASKFLADLMNMSDATYERSFKRLIQLFNNDMTYGDKSRLEGYALPFKNFVSYILPRGPIGKEDAHTFGMYTDVPTTFLYDVLGSPATWVVVTYVLISMINRAIKIIRDLRNGTEVSMYSKLFVIMIPVTICLYVVNGTFLTFVNISILYALSIGAWKNSPKEYLSKEM